MYVENLFPAARARLVTIPANASLLDAARLLAGTQQSLVVVCGPGGEMVGVISKTDIVRQVSISSDVLAGVRAEAVMTRETVCCHMPDELQAVLTAMREHGIVHMPVVDEQFRPIGLINARDALGGLLGEEHDQEALICAYVMNAGYR